ncbi:MAG: hypothetical protein IT366_08555 [Candidatus Hydrogenedentes bacterium]|nr:hypothetical protein [Candidatus Hydrogenedentota bacterium]
MLELRGLARRMLKQAKRPAGALFVLIYVCMFLPSVLNAFMARGISPKVAGEWILRGAPFAIGMLCLMAILAPESKISFNFKPAEIDVLFSGPYSRRQVITYKLLGTLTGALFVSVIFFIVSFALAPSKIALFFGIYLGVLFAALFSTAYSMLIQAVKIRVKILGYLTAASVVALLGYALYSVMRDFAAIDHGIADPRREVIELLFEHPVVRTINAPFLPFAHVMAADGSASAWWLWLTVAVSQIAALYLLIVLLDADFMEAAMARSARQYAMVERFKRGQFITERAATKKRRWSLPELPQLGGFGPIAWRQLTTAAHVWARRIVELYILCTVIGIVLNRYIMQDGLSDFVLPVIGGLLMYITLLAINFIRYDFRSEIDVMDGLKTLPISAMRISAAQLVTPTVLLSLIYVAVGLCASIATGRPGDAVTIALLGPPFAALFTGIENATFLVWPVRMAFQGGVDLQHMGRAFLSFFVKFIVLAPACGLAAAAGLGCALLFDRQFAGVVAAALVLTIGAICTVPATAMAFEKFDPSTDTPP